MDFANVIALMVAIALFAVASAADEAAPVRTGRGLSFPLHFLNDEQSTIAPSSNADADTDAVDDDEYTDDAGATTAPSPSTDYDFDNHLADELPTTALTPCQADCLESNSKSIDGQLFGTKEECLKDNACISCWLQCSFTRRLHAQPLRPVRVVAMVKQEFLVATHISWPRVPTLTSCYVTWEVAGGGLVGHLLTDAGNAELSLWPATKYRVVVVCKDTKSGKLVRSPTLFINTAQAISMKPDPPAGAETTATSNSDMLPFFNLDNRILKGSSDTNNRHQPQQLQPIEHNSIETEEGPLVRPAAASSEDMEQLRQTVFVVLAVFVYLLIDALLWGPCRYACRFASQRCSSSSSTAAKSALIDAEQALPEDCLAVGCVIATAMPAATATEKSSEHQHFVTHAEER